MAGDRDAVVDPVLPVEVALGGDPGDQAEDPGDQAEVPVEVDAVVRLQVVADLADPQAQRFASFPVKEESLQDRVVPMGRDVEEAAVAVERPTAVLVAEAVGVSEKLSNTSAASEKRKSFPVSAPQRSKFNCRSLPKSSPPCWQSRSTMC